MGQGLLALGQGTTVARNVPSSVVYPVVLIQ
jgi:hypothetical protein